MKKAIFILWGAIAIIVMGIGSWMYLRPKDAVHCPGDMVLAGGSDGMGGTFEAVNHLGETVTDKEVVDGLTLLYFGYTFCPDVCPVDTVRNAEITDLVTAQGIDLTPVFISVDPERDTPEVMADFVKYTHPDMIGLTGSNEQINALKALYRVYGQKQETGDEYYLVDHSAFTYLVTPKGFVSAYSRSQRADEIAENITCHATQMGLEF